MLKMAMTLAKTGFQLTKHLCYIQSTNRMVHTVADDQLNDYCDWMKRFDSRAYPVNICHLYFSVYSYIRSLAIARMEYFILVD